MKFSLQVKGASRGLFKGMADGKREGISCAMDKVIRIRLLSSLNTSLFRLTSVERKSERLRDAPRERKTGSMRSDTISILNL